MDMTTLDRILWPIVVGLDNLIWWLRGSQLREASSLRKQAARLIERAEKLET
jgi:hypothetical protein